MKEQIKELRVKIDGLAQLTKELKPIELNMDDYIMSYSDLIEYPNLKKNLKLHSKEIEKSYDNLILAKAWLGKVLGELGEDTPYKNDGKRKSVEDIEETADVAKNLTVNIDGGWEEMSHIQRVDWLREEINVLVVKVYDLLTASQIIPEIKVKHSRQLLTMYFDSCFRYLSEARMWLGFELGRIRDEK